tara:strand:+ start:488 stop:1096 length:609 start_codon:yes stop_codon:yes gene_type:complete
MTSEHEDEDDNEIFDIAKCPQCSSVTEHDILKRTKKGKGEDILSKCLECGIVHLIELRPPKGVFLNTTFSEGKKSYSGMIEVDNDEIISIGDIFQHEESDWKVTRIDNEISKPFEKLMASEIYAMWVIRIDKKIIKITMTDGENSTPYSLECSPDKIFSCGTIIEIEGHKWRIRAIHTGKGRTLRGKREAAEIKRMYLHSLY